MGDALLQKTYTVDFLTKKRVKNTGIMPQYYVKDNHEAIIPRDIFLQVQDGTAKFYSLEKRQEIDLQQQPLFFPADTLR